jgi:hypothetical protein
MSRTRNLGTWAIGTLFLITVPLAAQPPAEMHDAQNTRGQLHQMLDHYPPALRTVLGLDPSLLSNQSYLAPYPGLVAFLAAHPEVARNPSYFIHVEERVQQPPDHFQRAADLWKDIFAGMAVLTGFGIAITMVTWVIRKLIDYRKWKQLTKIQTDVHTKILDRLTANEDLIAYMQSPAGAKFLESAPITLDSSAPRTVVSAPITRILWSGQAGLVLLALGIGFEYVSGHVSDYAEEPFRILGVIGIALGIGFALSAVASYGLSHRLGLIEPPQPAHRTQE